GELLHALIVGKTGHMNELDAAVAGREQRALKKLRTYAMALPRLLDGECGLGFMGERGTERAQFGGASQNTVAKKAKQNRVQPKAQFDEILDELVRDCPPEPITPAFGVEPQQMIAIFGGFTDPEFADGAAVDKNVVHYGSPDG